MSEASRRPFTIYSRIDNDPFPEVDCDLYTAQNWALHFRCRPGEEERLLASLARTGSEVLTGEYVGGDSFAEWCEVYTDDTWYREHGTALHVYLTAPDLKTAIRRARALCVFVGYLDPRNVTLTTAGDWAEQAEVWDKKERTSA